MYSETCVFHCFSTVYDKNSYDDDMCFIIEIEFSKKFL